MTSNTEIFPSLDGAFGLTGKRAVVTGAGSGLAETIAKTLALAGASVVVAHDDMLQAERVAEEITANNGTALAAMCDVTDEASVVALFAEADAPDIVVLGAMNFGGVPAVETSAAQWDSMFAVNIRGAFLTAREAIKHMVAAGRSGRIIALSTIGSEHPVLHGNAAYSTSKAALNQLCRNLAFEHAADGIRCNAILAGAFQTNAPKMPGSEGYTASGPGFSAARHLLGRSDPADVGWLAVYLASPAAGFITGQTVVMDGGFQVG